MVFQFIFCPKNHKMEGKKVICVWIADFTVGSVSFQAISSPDRFLATSVQLETAKIMRDDPKDSWNVRYACIYIFQTKYFHECNHMKGKKDPSHLLKPSFTHFRLCLWTNKLYRLDCLFPHGLHGLCPEKRVPAALTLHLINNISPHWRGHTLCYDANPSSLVRGPDPWSLRFLKLRSLCFPISFPMCKLSVSSKKCNKISIEFSV